MTIDGGEARLAAIGAILRPKAVAIVGASSDPEKFSGQPLPNLLRAGYVGNIYAVNPYGPPSEGVETYPEVGRLPGRVDLGLVLLPAAKAVEAVEQLAGIETTAAIVAVSGFAEIGTEEGRRLQDALSDIHRKTGIRIMGPNCNGIYNVAEGIPLGYNFVHSRTLRPGGVGLVSHSGAMVSSFVSLAEREFPSGGLSHFVSCGNEVDLRLNDFFAYLIADPQTDVIALVVDNVADGDEFRRLARAARAAGKPVVAMKLGNSSLGRAATVAHSSRLSGSKRVYDAVFESEGIISVSSLEALVFVSMILDGGRRPSRSRVVATSTSGAGSIVLADSLAQAGVDLIALDGETEAAMSETSGFAKVMNPFDIGAGGIANTASNLHALADDPATGVLVCYLTILQNERNRLAVATAFRDVAASNPHLVILVVTPGPLEPDENGVYREAGIPLIGSTADATSVVASLVRQAQSSADGDATPPRTRVGAAAPRGARVNGPAARRDAGPLSERQSKDLLRARGVVFVREQAVWSVDEALEAARNLGYPVALKPSVQGLAHKSEEQLLALDVRGSEQLATEMARLERAVGERFDPDRYDGMLVSEFLTDGLEVMLGSDIDREFGPVITCGVGGTLAELIDDVAVLPLPVDARAARALIDKTRMRTLLEGYRGGPPLDAESLVEQVVVLARIADELCEEVQAIDLNPILVRPRPHGAVALDALVVRREPDDEGSPMIGDRR